MDLKEKQIEIKTIDIKIKKSIEQMNFRPEIFWERIVELEERIHPVYGSEQTKEYYERTIKKYYWLWEFQKKKMKGRERVESSYQNCVTQIFARLGCLAPVTTAKQYICGSSFSPKPVLPRSI